MKRKAYGDNTLLSDSTIEIVTGEAPSYGAFRFLLLFSFCLTSCFGLLFATTGAFLLPFPVKGAAVMSAFCLAFCLAFHMKKHGLLWALGPFGVYSLWLLLRYRYIVNSFCVAFKSIVETFSDYYHTKQTVLQPFADYAVKSSWEGLAAASTLAALILAFGMFRLKRWYLNVLLLAAGLFYPLLAGELPGRTGLYLCLLGGMGTVAVKGYVRKLKKEKVSRGSFLRLQSRIGVTAVLLAVASLLMGSIFLRPVVKRSFRGKAEIKQKIRDWWDTSAGLLEEDGNGGVGNGDLRECGKFTGGYKTQLRVTVSEKPTQPLYIQGYIGGSYEDSQWKPADAQAFHALIGGTELFPGMEEASLDPSAMVRNQTYRFARTFYGEGTDKAREQQEYRAENIAANPSYQYYPHGANLSEAVSIIGDGLVQGGASKEFIADFYPLPVYNRWVVDRKSQTATPVKAKNSWRPGHFNFIANEDVSTLYTFYVDERYLDVPDKVKEAYRQEAAALKGENQVEITQSIAALLKERTSYTTNPGKLPAGKDLAIHFLKESKKGYCSYYATAAALLLRMKEIPSRYVSGYVVWANQFEKNEDGLYEAEVTGNNAHAWAEVYDAQAGWIPMEATPGYNGNELAGRAARQNPGQSGRKKESGDNQKQQKKPETPQKTEQATHKNRDSKSPFGISGAGGDRATVLLVLAVATVISVALLAFCLHERKRRRQKELQISPYRSNCAVQRRFQSFYELLLAAGMKKEFHYSEQTIKDFLAQKDVSVEKEALERVLEIAMKACFSDRKITPEELEFTQNTLFLLAKEIAAGLSLLKRLLAVGTLHRLSR